ncbi:MAG: alpha/beta hydrolase [Candidatus Latescibacteria bacterium]|nr:alpha/beta hydrolase [Candidatus Latescibacterota bacterium]
MELVYPVIVVPGITATYLRDEYPLPPDYVWQVLRKNYDRVALHPNNLRYEAREPARVMPGQVFGIAYEELIEELRYNLRSKEDKHVPVFPFGYDWRMPLVSTEAQLDEFINEVIERTKLLKHYHEEGYSDNPKVNLVGHSMGGLVITGYLQKKKKKAPVHKVVTLATPYQGSFEAVIKITTGTANLGDESSSSRERETARITPALYHLLPSFENGISIDPGLPQSLKLFDPEAWQSSVTDSIAEFIRLKGITPENEIQNGAKKIFAGMLEYARKHRQRIDSFTLSDAGLSNKDWLAVVGVDAKTRTHLQIVALDGKPEFKLNSDDRKNEWENKVVSQRIFTGDGTVPYEGAIPTFLEEKNLVCVTPDDFGYWEIKDKALTKVAGFHGIIPNMNMLHRLIVRFFKNAPDPRGNTWGRPAPGGKDWDPPLELKKS